MVQPEPAAFAEFYRGHAAALLDTLAQRTGDARLAAELCAETFAVALIEAHRSDPGQDDAAAWLDRIGRRQMERAERSGTADRRARRRLGMAALEPGTHFLEELEEELVAAARFLDSRGRPRRRSRSHPRPSARAVRAALAGATSLALAAFVAALALGGDDRQPPPAPAGPAARLVPMVAPPRCFAGNSDELPAAPAMPDFHVFAYRQRADDWLGTDLGDGFALATYHPRETRLAANGRRGTRLHAVPSLGVASHGGCAADDGPGVCLLEDEGARYRCFTIAAIRDGLAFARTDRGSVVGIVTDGIVRVTLSAGGQRASAPVADNVYEAELDVAPGTLVAVRLERSGATDCAREVAPRLLERVAALRRRPDARLLPMAALSRLRDDERLAEIVERGARPWGTDAGVEFWVVPVVPSGRPACAPASRVCIVAVHERTRAGAQCLLDGAAWGLAPLLPGNAVALGVVPDRATGARVSVGGQSAAVDARDNVAAGLLPFPYHDYTAARLEPTYGRDRAKPRVGVVNDGEVRRRAERIMRRLGASGHPTVDVLRPRVESHTRLYWWPWWTTEPEARRIARLLGITRVIRIDDPARAPASVLETSAPIVVVVGRR
jgi:DNA-directed RNA polymerase specialized sigma24 family protein